LRIWKAGTEAAVCRRKLPSGLAARHADLHPNGQQLVSSLYSSMITIWNVGPWDAESWEIQETVSLDAGQPVLEVRFSPDGESLVALLKDYTVRVWRAPGFGKRNVD
jgi:WD40 repeat protein